MLFSKQESSNINNFVAMIDHEGVIEQIEGELAHVRIQSESACAACHAKGACGAAGQEEKYIDVPVRDTAYKVGEKVRVLVARHQGFRAVALGYLYPLLVLVATLVILIPAGVDELLAAPLALLSLPVYYLVLYLLRDRIGRSFTFSIQKNITGA